MDDAQARSQSGAMISDSKTATVSVLDRINLRLAGETFDAIDAARAARRGHISRNTWITEAVEEKLARDLAENGQEQGDADHA